MATILETLVRIDALYQGDSAVVKASASMQRLQQKTQSLQNLMGKVSSYQRMSSNLETARQRMQAAQEKAQQLGQQVSYSDKVTEGMRNQLARANSECAKSAEAFNKQKEALNAMRDALSASGINVNNLAEEEARLTQVTQRLTNAQNKFQSLRGQLTWDNMKGDIIKASAGTAIFRKPIQVDMDFEAQMSSVKAVSQASDEDFIKLRTQALELGSSTQFTATQAAMSQENLSRAGMKTDEIMRAMPAVLNMAAAEGMDLDSASAIIAKGLGGMNLGAELAPRLADILAYTSANTNTNIAMLGEGFKVAAPVMASQGVKMEQVAAYLGILANKGYEGSEAGNALSSSFQRLAKRPKQAYNALMDLGVATRTKDGKMVELTEIMRQIYVAFDKRKMGENEQLEYMANIFGQNYGKQMMAFMQATQAGDTATLENGVWNNSFGHAQKAATTRNDNLKGDLTALGSAWEGLMIRIGNALDPINRFVTQTLTTGISKVNEFIDSHQWLCDSIIQVAEAVGALMIVRKVWKYTTLAYQTFMAWRELHAAASAVEAVTGSLGGMHGILGTLSGVIMAHPIVIIGTLIAAGVALAIANWEKLKAWWESWTPAPKTALQIEQAETAKKEFTAKYGTQDFRPSYMKTASPSAVTPHATGGILTHPHIGLVAEAGPEAVIPLTNKHRGVPLVLEAARLLGLNYFFGDNVKNSSNFGTQEQRVINHFHENSSSLQNFTPLPKQEASYWSNSTSRSLSINPVSSFMRTAGDRVSSFVENNPVSSFMRNAGDRVSSFVSNNPVSSFMRNAGDRVSSFVSNNPVSSFMRNAGDRVSSFVSNNPVSSFMRNAGDRVSSFVSNNPVSSFMRNAGDRVSSFVSNNPVSSFMANFSGAPSNSYNDAHFFEQAGESIQQRHPLSDNRRTHSGMAVPDRQGQALTPTINITVNSAPSEDPQGLAARIALAVQDAMREAADYQERVAYAQ